MAELTGKAISELPESTTVNNAALVALSENGASKKMTLATLVGNLLKKTGDTMTGDLTILQSEPRLYLKDSEMDTTDVSPSQSNNILLAFRDKNNRIQSRIQGQFNTSGKSLLSIGPRRVVNGSEIGNYLDLSVDVNGNRIIEVTSPAAWRDALYAVNKTGDTMTGIYRFKGSNLDKDVAADSWSDSYPVVVDKDGDSLGNVRAFTLATGVSGVQLTGQNGSYQNFLRLGETANNEHYVAVTSPGKWRNALGLCYAVNNTFTNSYIIENGYVSTSTTEVWLTVSTPLSMENISTVTVTSLNGVMRGINGYLNNVTSNTNFATASGYTVTATKQSNHEARVVIKKSSAYTNVDNNTPVSYAGAITLKFT